MTADGTTAAAGSDEDELRDRVVSLPVTEVTQRYDGMKWDVVTETVVLADGQQGRRDVVMLEDNWTIVTQDRQPAAHFEHTVAITESGVEILTDGQPVAANGATLWIGAERGPL